jgi:uracil-DNA glycosylase
VNLRAMSDFTTLLQQVRDCTLCEPDLPLGARPVLQIDSRAAILIAGQAPGRKVHDTGIPFNDPSGERLRLWLGVSRDCFYDAAIFALVPMGFCYPGTGPSGDLPPPPQCARTWRQMLLARLPRLELTVALGKHALSYHCGRPSHSVTQIVKAWREYWPSLVPMAHPSPRNNLWLKQNPWFEQELVPALRSRVAEIIDRNKKMVDK